VPGVTTVPAAGVISILYGPCQYVAPRDEPTGFVKVRDAEETPIPTTGLLLLISTEETFGCGRVSQLGGTVLVFEAVSIRETLPFFEEASALLTNIVTARLLHGGVALPACDGKSPGGNGATSM
jgi:hypothetical protein